MGKYRKRPVVIEAHLFGYYEGFERGHNGYDLAQWCGGRVIETSKPSDHTDVNIKLLIPTLEGVMTAQAGDWIIKGVNGEFYPCKPDIFEATYEEVIDWHKDQGFKDPY